MGTSVLQCDLCQEFYKEFLKDKRKMRFMARIHKGHDYKAAKLRSDATQGKGLG